MEGGGLIDLAGLQKGLYRCLEKTFALLRFALSLQAGPQTA
jgi:hypothetical protein